jgi:CBS-domain-containing membrane protein
MARHLLPYPFAMKYLAVLAVGGAIYLYFACMPKHPPEDPVATVKALTGASDTEPGTDFLKEPLDRTHEVMKQAKQRSDDPALQ